MPLEPAGGLVPQVPYDLLPGINSWLRHCLSVGAVAPRRSTAQLGQFSATRFVVP